MNGGVVDEDVDGTEFFNGFLNDFFAMTLFFEITGDDDAFAIGRSALLSFVCVVMFVEIGDSDVGSFFCEEYCDGAPDAAVATGDECDFVEEFTGTGTIVFGDGLWRHGRLMSGARLRLWRADFSWFASLLHNGFSKGRGKNVARRLFERWSFLKVIDRALHCCLTCLHCCLARLHSIYRALHTVD